MRLYLVQHGEALPKDVDPDRPLSGKGREDARRLAEFLGERGIRVSRVFHSGKTRARQTAEIIAATVMPDEDGEARAGLNPNDPVEPMAERVSDWEQDAMLIGHLPFMERFAGRLVAGAEERSIVAFEPGSMVCLERLDPDGWRVAWMLRPELFS
jgi:phosphohistidine phosphatase